MDSRGEAGKNAHGYKCILDCALQISIRENSEAGGGLALPRLVETSPVSLKESTAES
jgi:hypothetical protein